MTKPKVESTDALILACSKYQDDSAVITLSGENGIFSVLARGVYKPKSVLKPLLVIGNFVSLEYRVHQKGLGFASSLKVLEDASVLYQDYRTSCFLLFLQELTLSLFRYGDEFPQEEIQSLIRGLSLHKDLLSLTLLMMGTFYRRFGINIETRECIRCHATKNIVAFSLPEGGFLCGNCAKEMQVEAMDTMDLYVLKYAFSKPDAEAMNKKVPTAQGIRIFLALLNNLVSYYDLKPIRCLSLFLQALQEN